MVKMTAMPQLVSIFNAVGGGAAALLAIDDILEHRGSGLSNLSSITGALDIAIGLVTFTGSLIAAGRLQGWIPGKPLPVYRGSGLVNLALVTLALAAGTWLVAEPRGDVAIVLLLTAAAVFGVTMVLPIGGADMPVVISLLNAFTGTAVAMAGFVIDKPILIIAGALVGASGSILTKLMAEAMNRSLADIMLGGFGTGDAAAPAGAVAGSSGVRTVSAEDAAIQLGYASKVILVPGYGLAAAQAQHELGNLAAYLESHGVAVSGMPILDVDRAKSIIVIRRSLGHGYAGLDNELYTDPKTAMFFSDAKAGLAELLASLKTLGA